MSGTAHPSTGDSPRGIESIWAHLLLAFLSSGLLWLAFPAVAWGWLAHLALVPMAVLASRSTKLKRLGWTTYVAALIWWLLTIHWMSPVTVGGYIALSFYMALYTPAALFTARWLHRRLHWPMFLVLPMAWVSFEMLRGRLLAGGFGWFALAQSQVAWPPADDPQRLIQIADLFGESGLSFLVAMTNGLIVDAILGRRERASGNRRVLIASSLVWLGAIVGAWTYGQYRINQTVDLANSGPVIATVQTNVPHDNKLHPTPEQQERDFGRMRDLTRSAAAALPKPQIIVWPETMVPSALNREAIEHFTTATSGWRGNEAYHLRVESLARELGVSLLVGGHAYFDWILKTAEDGQQFELPGKRFNSAFLYHPDGLQAEVRYDKVHRVPFGEFIPWVDHLPRLKQLFLQYLSPYAYDYTLQPGTQFTVLEARPSDSQLVRLATPICFEDTIARVCRPMVYGRAGQKRADLLINLTNDGWFVGTPQGAQHLQLAALRCVELRVPMVRSVNTGISGFIDSVGHIGPLVQENGRIQGIDGFANATTKTDPRLTVYGRIGDIPAGIVVCLTAALAIASRFRRR